MRDWEPAAALFSGADGLAATARLVRQAAAVLEPDGLFAVEVDARRASLAAELRGERAALSRLFESNSISPDASDSCSRGESTNLDPPEGAMIEDKAKDLGRLIGQSTEYKEVKRAERRAERGQGHRRAAAEDGAAPRRRAAHARSAASARPRRWRRSSTRCSARSRDEPTYQRLLVAQENFDKMMARVNDWILDGIEKGAASPIITLS